MSADIIKRLAENAHVLEAHRYTEAAATMREAAEIIAVLRKDAAGMADVLRDVAFCIPSSAHSYNYDSDCDWPVALMRRKADCDERMTRLLALDVSLNATGIVYPDGRIDVLRPPKALRGGDRLWWWWKTWGATLQDARPDRIVIEQPFAGKIRGDSTAKLQQAYGVLLAQIAYACPTAVLTWVPPATLKKAATGKGNASKAEMIAAANIQPAPVRCGLQWFSCSPITDDNEADAWLLWVLCRAGEFDK